jgi:hypothetical protein
MADTSAIDEAVVQRLATDSTLLATLPGGVAWDVAVAGATKFVIVSQVEHDDAYVMGPGIARERIVYLVKAVAQGTSGTDVRSGAARIQALLQDQIKALAPAGYTVILAQRIQRIRYTEVDEVTDQRWQHRGGHYEIQACPF